MLDWLKKDAPPRASKLVQNLLDQTGWSQNQLALELGTSQPTVSRWLSGKQQPNYFQTSMLHKIKLENMTQKQLGYTQSISISAIISSDLSVAPLERNMSIKSKFRHGWLSRWSIGLEIDNSANVFLGQAGWIAVVAAEREGEWNDKSFYLLLCRERGVLLRQSLPGSEPELRHLIAPGLPPILDSDASRRGVVIGVVPPETIERGEFVERGEYENAYFN